MRVVRKKTSVSSYPNDPQRRLQTAGNSVKAYNRINGAATRSLREDLPPSALEGGACEAGGPGPHGGFLLLGMTTSASGNL